ncbi:MAG: TRAP transporter substrate-binding protein [Hyphomicrobiales bacterium]
MFDAVATGTAEIAHTASFFWQGKVPAAAFFTAVPFGLTPLEHMAWIEAGGGQQIWDDLYRPFGVKPFMAGNTGFQMGGWYRKEINGLDDIKGLKIRMPGLGGEVLRRLGATPVSLPPGEILPALQSGVVDATEFLGPFSDIAMGFYKVAPFYYWPGFHEPNGTGEAVVSLKALEALPDDLKAIVATATSVESATSLAEAEWENGAALARLIDEHGVELMRFRTKCSALPARRPRQSLRISRQRAPTMRGSGNPTRRRARALAAGRGFPAPRCLPPATADRLQRGETKRPANSPAVVIFRQPWLR